MSLGNYAVVELETVLIDKNTISLEERKKLSSFKKQPFLIKCQVDEERNWVTLFAVYHDILGENFIELISNDYQVTIDLSDGLILCQYNFTNKHTGEYVSEWLQERNLPTDIQELHTAIEDDIDEIRTVFLQGKMIIAHEFSNVNDSAYIEVIFSTLVSYSDDLAREDLLSLLKKAYIYGFGTIRDEHLTMLEIVAFNLRTSSNVMTLYTDSDIFNIDEINLEAYNVTGINPVTGETATWEL